MSGLIDRMFQCYRRMVIPADAPAVQVEECRRAFFAGASTLFKLLTQHVSDGEDITEQDMRMMGDIQNELSAFGAQLDLDVLARTRQ